MKQILYLECGSGISGDMTVGALLDLGADREKLERALASLPVPGFRTEIGRVSKSGLDCCDFRVILDDAHENHDHDMAWLHGRDLAEVHEYPGHDHDHDDHDHDHHHHDHDHDHGHGHSHHEHRGLPEILAIIDQADMTPAAKELAAWIFRILGEAESRAHGVPAEQVHFHEVGAVDSIVDIIAAACCLDDLGVTDVVIPPMSEGYGTIRCQHGRIPVPVPAVVNIVSAYGLELRPVDTEGELVTPTGAAIAAAIRTRSRLPEHFRILRTGIGAGKRSYNRPSMLRAMLLEESPEETSGDRIWKLESNIDDCSGEILGHVLEKLMAAGARDVHYIPVYMKKNRPGVQINVICTEETRGKLEDIIFRETTTIGIRRTAMERSVMDRHTEEVMTSFGPARVKICTRGDIRKVTPEYEDAARLSREAGISLQEAYGAVLQAVQDPGTEPGNEEEV